MNSLTVTPELTGTLILSFMSSSGSQMCFQKSLVEFHHTGFPPETHLESAPVYCLLLTRSTQDLNVSSRT